MSGHERRGEGVINRVQQRRLGREHGACAWMTRSARRGRNLKTSESKRGFARETDIRAHGHGPAPVPVPVPVPAPVPVAVKPESETTGHATWSWTMETRRRDEK